MEELIAISGILGGDILILHWPIILLIQSGQTANDSSCQIILSLSQLFISRMAKMCAIPQLVSAPLNPIPIAEHFRRSHPQCEHSYGQNIYMSEECY